MRVEQTHIGELEFAVGEGDQHWSPGLYFRVGNMGDRLVIHEDNTVEFAASVEAGRPDWGLVASR